MYQYLNSVSGWRTDGTSPTRFLLAPRLLPFPLSDSSEASGPVREVRSLLLEPCPLRARPRAVPSGSAPRPARSPGHSPRAHPAPTSLGAPSGPAPPRSLPQRARPPVPAGPPSGPTAARTGASGPLVPRDPGWRRPPIRGRRQVSFPPESGPAVLGTCPRSGTRRSSSGHQPPMFPLEGRRQATSRPPFPNHLPSAAGKRAPCPFERSPCLGRLPGGRERPPFSPPGASPAVFLTPPSRGGCDAAASSAAAAELSPS